MNDSLPARFLAAAARCAKRPALSWREGDERHSLSYAQMAERVAKLAAGFSCLGLKKGDRVLLLADNSPLWIQTDLALLHIGAVDVPRGSDTLPEELEYIVGHADARAAVIGDPSLLDSVAARLDAFEFVVCLEGEAEGTLSLDDVIAAGAEQSPGPPVPDTEDLATIVYTSGTTGTPKGVPLTHGNILHNVKTIPEIAGVVHHDRFLSILPAWHVYERTVEYVIMAVGAEMVYTSRRRLKEDMASEAPTFLAAVPRVLEALYEGVNRAFRESSRARRALAAFLLRRSHALARARTSYLTERLVVEKRSGSKFGSALTYFLRALPNAPFHLLGKILVYRKILRATGGRLRAAVSGGGSLPRHVEEFFDSVGMMILVGYGLTETSPVVSVRRPEQNVRGTIGSCLPDTEVEIRHPQTREPLPVGEEGVLWYRGPQVFKGYYRDPEKTAEVLDAEGWFDTGDLGRMMPWGDVVFTGRAKETIVLRGGENVEPEPIEMALTASPLIRQVIVIGQDEKHLGALIVPDVDLLAAKCGGQPTLEPSGPAEKEIRSEVNRLLDHRKGYRAYERVHALCLIEDEFKIEDGTLTPTLKMRRDRITARHAAEIEALFGGK